MVDPQGRVSDTNSRNHALMSRICPVTEVLASFQNRCRKLRQLAACPPCNARTNYFRQVKISNLNKQHKCKYNELRQLLESIFQELPKVNHKYSNINVLHITISKHASSNFTPWLSMYSPTPFSHHHPRSVCIIYPKPSILLSGNVQYVLIIW